MHNLNNRDLLFLLLLFSFGCVNINGLSKLEEETAGKIEAEAISYYETNEKLKAVNTLKKLYYEYPKSKNHALTFYNIAYTYYEIDSIEAAILWYNRIITSDIKENQEHYSFPDTHANVKHKSCVQLGNIYYNRGEFEKAAKNYEQALEKFRYVSSSGTSLKKNNIQVRRWLSDSFLKLGENREVIRVLLSDAITTSPYLENQTATYLAEFIELHYSDTDFYKDLSEALKKVKQLKNKREIFIWDMKVIIPDEGYELDEAEFMNLLNKKDE